MVAQVDVVVVGMGIAGESVVGPLVAGGLSVAAVERGLIGGECNNWACVPTKMAVRAAGLLAEARRIDGFAGSAQVRPDWSPVAARITHDATHGWTDDEAVAGLTGKGVRFLRGSAVLTGPGRVRVDDVELAAARAVVLATGTTPAVPDIEGLAGTPYWTNHDAARLTDVPASVVVLGGGPVGLELAQILARFGSRVTLIETADRLLAGEDPDASAVAVAALTADGVTVHTGTTVVRVEYTGDAFVAHLDRGEPVTAARLLVATGRRMALDGLGLETVGLDPAAGVVAVDDRLRAGGGLWAIGDITGRGAFTHVGTYQARIAAADILGQEPPGADYRAVPRVVYTDPEIGAVGLTEEQARHAGIRVHCGRIEVATSARGWLHGPGGTGVIKLVADADREILVGAVSAGPTGGEVLGLLTLAVRAQVPLRLLRDMMYAYPSFHRGIEDALRELSTVDTTGAPVE